MSASPVSTPYRDHPRRAARMQIMRAVTDHGHVFRRQTDAGGESQQHIGRRFGDVAAVIAQHMRELRGNPGGVQMRMR